MLGGAGACHKGELDWDALSVYASSRTRKWDAPRYNRHTAGAWEHLNHVILGGEPLKARRRARARIPRCAPSDFGSRWRIARETPSTRVRLDGVEVDTHRVATPSTRRGDVSPSHPNAGRPP